MTQWKCRTRGALVTAALGSMLASSVAHAQAVVESKGNWRKGEMTVELYRGVGVPDEILVIPTPGECGNHVTAHLEWDQEANYVKVRLTGTNVLEPNPTVIRTEGVNFFPNAWWQEPKDVVNGRYQLWVVLTAEEREFYYDATTLEFLGSEFDFEMAPAGAIVVTAPGFNAVPTDFFQPDENGNLDFTHVFPYDKMVRGDLPAYAHSVGSFVPQSLCTAHPFRYDLTSTRPYISPTRPASEARPFSDYLRAGLIFDVTVEPPEYYVYPPTATNVATYSQTLPVAGGVPKGWELNLDAVFSNVAPAIRPWESAGKCEAWFKPVRNRDFNMCLPPGE